MAHTDSLDITQSMCLTNKYSDVIESNMGYWDVLVILGRMIKLGNNGTIKGEVSPRGLV